MPETPVAVIGGGVVGAAVAYTLARHGVPSTILEAEHDIALGASGTNSGILHTGFDSPPGEFETELILRAARLREPVLDELGVPVRHCGAILRARNDDEEAIVDLVARGADVNGVEVHREDERTLSVPGESITDPVAYTRALIAAAEMGGAQLRTRARVERIARIDGELALGLAAGGELTCTVAVNSAGLDADEVARMAGDESFAIYPRKGEFFVFEPPEPLEHILLPVPTKRTKGVLVFPALDGHVVAGPTAHDQDDKRDWSVRPEAYAEVIGQARSLWPPLEAAEPIASYAGLRPAGRGGVNYRIGSVPGCEQLVNVAAIRSTGLTASLGIGAYVAELVAGLGIELGPERPLRPAEPPPADDAPWWRRRAQLGTAAR